MPAFTEPRPMQRGLQRQQPLAAASMTSSNLAVTEQQEQQLLPDPRRMQLRSFEFQEAFFLANWMGVEFKILHFGFPRLKSCRAEVEPSVTPSERKSLKQHSRSGTDRIALECI